MYHLTLVSTASIPNLRPPGPDLHVEKFVWWVGGWVVVGGGGWVCKVILVFRFGPRLGLKTEDLGQAEQQESLVTSYLLFIETERNK